MSKEEIVGIEEALAKTYQEYVKYLEEYGSDGFDKSWYLSSLLQWLHENINPQPEWDLIHLHRLIITADINTAVEIVKSRARCQHCSQLDFKSFVETLIDECDNLVDIQDEAKGEARRFIDSWMTEVQG